MRSDATAVDDGADASKGHRVLRHRDRVPGPWANGGGITYEVVRSPEGSADFDWRLSIAEVAREGPFSAFPGVDRVIIALRGAMELVIDGTGYAVPPLTPMAFPGEARLEARLPGGPTMDLNVMTRRDRVTADVDLRTGPVASIAPLRADEVAAIVLEGTWEAEGIVEPLGTWDCVIVAGPLDLRGDGMLACVTFSDRAHPTGR